MRDRSNGSASIIPRPPDNPFCWPVSPSPFTLWVFPETLGSAGARGAALWSVEQLAAQAVWTLPGCGAKGDESAAHRELRRLRRARPGVTWLLFPPQQDFGQVTSLLGFLISNWP